MTTDLEKADRLEHCIKIMQGNISILRGEYQDLTGRGMWQILESALEMLWVLKF